MVALRIAVAFAAAILLAGCAAHREPKISSPAEARELSERALDQLDAGDAAAALKSLNRVIALGGAQDSDYTRRAAAHGALGQYDSALTDTDVALRLAPNEWRTHFQRSLLNQKLGRIDAALTDLDHAIALNVDDASLLRRRGYLTLVAGRFADAVTAYDQLARVEAHSLAAATGRGVAFYVAGDWRAAAHEFDKLLTDIPEDARTALWFVKASLRAPYPVQWERFNVSRNGDPEWGLVQALETSRDLEDIQKLVGALTTSTTRRGITPCERALFMGEWRVIRLAGEGAANAFEAALKACPTDSIERTQAKVELARLRSGWVGTNFNLR